MRRFTQILFCLVLTGIYLTATAGFPVHRCLKEGSYYVLLFAEDTSCEKLHSQENMCHAGCCTGHHDESCCNTQVYSVDDPTIIQGRVKGSGQSSGTKDPVIFSALLPDSGTMLPAVQFADLPFRIFRTVTFQGKLYDPVAFVMDRFTPL